MNHAEEKFPERAGRRSTPNCELRSTTVDSTHALRHRRCATPSGLTRSSSSPHLTHQSPHRRSANQRRCRAYPLSYNYFSPALPGTFHLASASRLREMMASSASASTSSGLHSSGISSAPGKTRKYLPRLMGMLANFGDLLLTQRSPTVHRAISQLFSALPSMMDLNYPPFAYVHSDDAVPHLSLHSRSSSSSSSESSSGISTPPPASPLLPPTKDEVLEDELDPLPSHWEGVGALRLPPPPPPSPAHAMAATPTRKHLPVAKPKATPIASQTLSLQPTVPSAPTKRAKAAPAAVPTREAEEETRGRSRWPRLLWASTIDDESLTVLRSYHERAVGGPLPRLDRDAGSRGVSEWSTELEKAGL